MGFVLAYNRGPTWRIIPVNKWFTTMVSKWLEGEQPYLGGLLTMVINHLLTGMILQLYTKRFPNILKTSEKNKTDLEAPSFSDHLDLEGLDFFPDPMLP